MYRSRPLERLCQVSMGQSPWLLDQNPAGAASALCFLRLEEDLIMGAGRSSMAT